LVIDSSDSRAYGAEKAIGGPELEQVGHRGFPPVWRVWCAAPFPKGRKVNKAQLIDAVADKLESSRRAAGEAVDAVLNGITGAVIAGDKVSLTGFGTFETASRPARTARNPRTGEAVKVAAATVPKFRAGQAFKDEVNGAHATAKKSAARKTVAKRTSARSTVAKTAAPAKRSATKATAAKTATASRGAAKSAASKAAPAKKTAAAATAKKSTAKRAAARPSARKSAATAPATKNAVKKPTAKNNAAKKSTANKR
jgi:DNA-binding protein HU-beta